MIQGNKKLFGYGDISVRVCIIEHEIYFQQFKPPANCGDKIEIKNVEFIGKEIRFRLSYDDYVELKSNLEKV